MRLSPTSIRRTSARTDRDQSEDSTGEVGTMTDPRGHSDVGLRAVGSAGSTAQGDERPGTSHAGKGTVPKLNGSGRLCRTQVNRLGAPRHLVLEDGLDPVAPRGKTG
jgi:hypothetical protein